MENIHDFFTIWDWLVVFGYLALTTVVGHAMRGKQASIRDFFLGGKSLPWQAVSGSMIATEISGVTFIGVPGTLFALHGNFTYLQWAIGSILARIIVGMYFVRVYYEREIYSPYDYMGLRLGSAAKTLTTVLFTIGSILAQSVRVLVAAIPLEVVTGMPLWACIIAIGVFAIGWTLMGGMRTVIWTDVMQFVLFVVGGLIALFAIVNSLNGGWGEMITTAKEFGRTKMLDTRLQADLQFTIWVALFAVPFQNLGIFGTDQLMAQRMFCCRDAKAASKAIIFSSFGQLITLLMLLVGAALFVSYQTKGFNVQELAILMEPKEGQTLQQAVDAAPFAEHPVTGAKSNLIVPSKGDYIFPIWIVTMLPVGLSGLILAGVFAAAISSLDSILAALSQTTLSLLHNPEKGDTGLTESQLLNKSRKLVVIWGIVLVFFTFAIEMARENIPILPLAFGMTAYTVGPILAIFLCAMLGRGSMSGLIIGAVISMILTMFVRMDIWVLVKTAGFSIDWLASLPTYKLNAAGDVGSTFSYVWMWPISAILTLALGLLVPGGKQADAE
jgi:SSS family solute:Na+ symporter